MTCDEYTRLLMTRSWSELNESEAALHARTCGKCSELREAVERAENRLEYAMAAARSSIHPDVLADRAIAGARLRTLERGLFIIPIVIVSLILWLGFRELPASTVQLLTGRRPLPALTTETIALQCLSAEQARDLARPYVDREENVIVGRGSIPTVTVRGTAAAVKQAKRMLAEFEQNPGAACRKAQGAVNSDARR